MSDLDVGDSTWADKLGFGPGTTGPGSSRYQGDAGVKQAETAFDGMGAPQFNHVTGQPVNVQRGQVTSQGPSAMGGIQTDPSGMAAQRAQMAALSSLAANGGRNASSDANLAQIQQGENANAAGQRGAIMQNMAARGQGGSGNELLAQLSASQNATNNQSMQDLGVRGQQAQTALQAGQGAAQIGAGMENQQFGEAAARAQAADAISRFNAGNASQNSQFNAGQGNQAAMFNSGQNVGAQQANNANIQQGFGDTMGVAGGRQHGGEVGAGYGSAANAAEQRARAGVLGGFMGMAGSYMGSKGDSGAAWGGKVPGQAAVPGNSYANDTVKVNTSPGEVIVPRTLAHSGNPSAISHFVQNPPKIGMGDKNKEAMLGALKHLGRR